MLKAGLGRYGSGSIASYNSHHPRCSRVSGDGQSLRNMTRHKPWDCAMAHEVTDDGLVRVRNLNFLNFSSKISMKKTFQQSDRGHNNLE